MRKHFHTVAEKAVAATEISADTTKSIATEAADVDEKAWEVAAGETVTRTSDSAVGEVVKQIPGLLSEIDSHFAAESNPTASSSSVATTTMSALGTLSEPSSGFGDLSTSMKAKFATAGLRNGWRPADVSTEFFTKTIPSPVRNLGENSVKIFVKGKHASHIESVRNAPAKAMNSSNIVWESANKNLSRGAANMMPRELVKANASNILHVGGIVLRAAAKNAARAGVVGLALEALVSVPENLICLHRGSKTPKKALKQIGKDVLTKGGLSAAFGAGITMAVALGAGPVLLAVAPALFTIGGTLYLKSAYKRIGDALKSGEPAIEVLDSAPKALVPAF